ncbi:uncharacterized protein [Enoplosus armatus]|uniref:uncharacterized protein n=1 Tax=Enoplosus armatus TaxID=215367 RepID=UPI003992ED21
MHFSYFRMSAPRFDELLHRIEPYIEHGRTHSSPVSLQERLAVTLRVLASGSSQKSVAASYQLGSATVSLMVSEVCQAIWKALRRDFVSEPKASEWTDIARDFWRVWNFPNCVGSMDEKRLQIKSPPDAGGDDFKHKGNHSVVLLAASDAKYRFTVVDVGACGPESDGGTFQDSEFGSRLLQGTLDLPPPATLPGTNITTPHVFLGDAVFPLNVHLMRPYPGINLDDAQTAYNHRHSQARRVIENTFGVLTARWRILGRPIDFHCEKTVDVVKACVALHNMLAYTDAAAPPTARYIPPKFVDGTAASGELLPGEWRGLIAGDNLLEPGRLSTAVASQAAIAVRNDLKAFFQTPQGLVPLLEEAV